MSNGKFFSGLTERMMRQRAPHVDHMKTQIFWPDETDAEENNRNPVPKAKLVDLDYTSQTENEENAELMRVRRQKQLNSGIQFYDMVDNSEDQQHRSNRNERNRRTDQNEQSYNNIRQAQQRQQVDSDIISENERSIRDNNYVEKTQSSKTTSNTSDINGITQNVHDIKISMESHDDGVKLEEEIDNNYRKTNGMNKKNDYYTEDSEDDYIYRKNLDLQKKRSKAVKTNVVDQQDERRNYSSNNNSNESNCRRIPVTVETSFASHNKTTNSNFFETNGGESNQDYYANKQSRARREENVVKTTPASVKSPLQFDDEQNVYYNKRNYDSETRYGTESTSNRLINRKNNMRNGYNSEMDNRNSGRNRLSKGYNHSDNYESDSNFNNCYDAKQTANRHLKSNFSFTNASNDSDSSQKKPSTIRESATSRVVVGLPDI